MNMNRCCNMDSAGQHEATCPNNTNQILNRDSGTSQTVMYYCPYCGTHQGIHNPGCPFLTSQTPYGYSQIGWICPKCGKVFSPDQKECSYCNGTSLWIVTCECKENNKVD